MSEQSLESIYNFLQLSDSIATAGQPTAEQFSAVKTSGYQVVVNLAPSTSPKYLSNEQQIVEGLGMGYIHLPVVWENPTVEDARQFFKVIEAHKQEKIFVHCAANMRVSAFMYLYRRLREGRSDAEAKLDLERIWTPNEIWQKFIQAAIESEG